MKSVSKIWAPVMCAVAAIFPFQSSQSHPVMPLPKVHFASAKLTNSSFPFLKLSAHSTIAKTTLIGPAGLSGSGRSLLQTEKNVIFAGLQTGASKFAGGAIASGQLFGTLYISTPSITFGTFAGNIGTSIPATYNTSSGYSYNGIPLSANTPFQNSINFVPPVNLNGPVGFRPAKGLQGFINELSARSVGAGENVFAQSFSHLQGGVLVGTLYRNSLNSSPYGANYLDGHYAFAFGNSPYNIGGFFASPPLALPINSSLTLASGKVLTLKNGQFLFPFTDTSNISKFGGLLTFGSNPLNSLTNGSIANNLKNFLFF